jgi:hypothetical protein
MPAVHPGTAISIRGRTSQLPAPQATGEARKIQSTRLFFRSGAANGTIQRMRLLLILAAGLVLLSACKSGPHHFPEPGTSLSLAN